MPSLPTKAEAAAYFEEQGLQTVLNDALNTVVGERAADGTARLAELIGAKAGKPAATPAGLLPRPRSAHGKFLRILTVNDVYILNNYPRLCTAKKAALAEAADIDAVVISTLPGDFLSPCSLTAIDGGRAMTEALNHAMVDYVILGNHEFDFGFEVPVARMNQFKGKCLNSNITEPEFPFPKYDVVDVGGKKVVLGGFLTQDTSIYAPSNTPKVMPAPEAAEKVWEAAKAQLGAEPDCFIPMTHALVPEDKKTCVALSKHKELGKKSPILLGGHEHDQYIDSAGNSVIVKVGQDAERIGVVDVWWTEKGEMLSRVTTMPSSDFEPDPTANAFVKEQHDFLMAMMNSAIATVPSPMSSKKVRFEPSGVASFLLSYVAKGYKKDGADLAMVQGGFIRAKKDYVPGPFKMGDLFGEFAFEGPFATIPLKGSIIQESTLATRNAPKPAPNFLHFDHGVVLNDEHMIQTVGGQPFDPEKIYSVAIYHHLLTGLNIIEPLMSYVTANVNVPDTESCRPVKDVVLEMCMKDEWKRLIGFKQFDADGDGDITPEELRKGIEKVTAEMDKNGDGLVSKEELAAYVQAQGGELNLIEQLIKTIDEDGDGMISKEEFMALGY